MISNETLKDTITPSTREKAQTWTKSDGDRFIPRRISLNINEFNLHTHEIDLASRDTRPDSSSISSLLKLSFSELQVSEPKKQFFRYRTNTEPRNVIDALDEHSIRRNKIFKQRKFILPEKPYKILEAPNISDDFYHNIFDWSCSNILSICLGNSIYMLQTDTGTVNKLYEAYDCETITSVQWNNTGDQLAVGNVLGQISIWDVNTQKEINTFDSHQDRICTIDWKSTLISGSKDTSIVQHDFRLKIPQIYTYLSHINEVCKLKWSPDEQYFCSGGNDNKVFVWTPMNSIPLMKESHNACIKALAWSEKQYGVLATGGGAADRTIKTWNVQTRELTHERVTESQVCSLVFSKHTNDLISAHGYPLNEITLWRTNGLKKIGSLYGHSERVLYLNLSPCASTLVSGSADETLRFWKLYDESFVMTSVRKDGLLESSNIR